MKTKVIATILGMVFCSALLCATDVSAGWYYCTIDQVGPGWDLILIKVSDTAAPPVFTKKWCVFPENLKNQMLAVAITAKTNDQTILININPSIDYPTVRAIYLDK